MAIGIQFPNDFLSRVQRFAGIECVGTSTLRRQPAGVLEAVRQYFGQIDLHGMPHNPQGFGQWMDNQTTGLRNHVQYLYGQAVGLPWGMARKALNLFLRYCFYNHYLRGAYHLDEVEALLEIPLDRYVARALRQQHQNLPAWGGLTALTRRQHQQFQTAAANAAVQQGLPARVHLDLYLWLDNRPQH